MDEDWPAVCHNLQKAQKQWAKIARVLSREGGMRPKVCGSFYKAVVQQALLYCCETWVVSDAMLTALRGFHHRIARQISGLTASYCVSTDTWTYPPIADALQKAGLHTIEEYIQNCQNTLAETIATHPILDLCLETERESGSSSRLHWWTQTGFSEKF